MKNLLALAILFSSYLLAPPLIQAQSISYVELREVMDLYLDGQYDIVKAKLNNYGFVVTKSTPDYTLHGTTHTGDFTMMRERESPYENLRAGGIKAVDRWFFSTTNGPCWYAEKKTLREISISFDSSERGGVEIYNYFVSSWNNWIDNNYKSCSTDRSCQLFNHHWVTKGRNPTVDAGQQKIDSYLTLVLEMSQEPILQPGYNPIPHEYIHGTFEQREFYGSLPIPVTKRSMSKRPILRRK